MQDAVADILLERTGVDGSRAAGIALSMLIHASIVLLAIATARSADRDPRRVITLRLSAAPRSAVPRAVASPRRAAAVPPKISPKPAPATEVKAPPIPVTSEAPKSEVHQRSLFGRATKAPAKAPAPSAAPLPPAAVVAQPGSGEIGATVPAVGSAGVTAIDGGDFPFDTYLSRMVSLVGTHWFRPQTKGDALVVVSFVINRDGSIRDTAIERPSGSSLFDRAALRSVVESSPLPPLPFAFQGTFLGVHLTFH